MFERLAVAREALTHHNCFSKMEFTLQKVSGDSDLNNQEPMYLDTTYKLKRFVGKRENRLKGMSQFSLQRYICLDTLHRPIENYVTSYR